MPPNRLNLLHHLSWASQSWCRRRDLRMGPTQQRTRFQWPRLPRNRAPQRRCAFPSRQFLLGRLLSNVSAQAGWWKGALLRRQRHLQPLQQFQCRHQHCVEVRSVALSARCRAKQDPPGLTNLSRKASCELESPQQPPAAGTQAASAPLQKRFVLCLVQPLQAFVSGRTVAWGFPCSL